MSFRKQALTSRKGKGASLRFFSVFFGLPLKKQKGNNNVGREQDITKEGCPKFKVSYSKVNWTLSRVIQTIMEVTHFIHKKTAILNHENQNVNLMKIV